MPEALVHGFFEFAAGPEDTLLAEADGQMLQVKVMLTR